MTEKTVADAVSAFGASVKSKLASPAIAGAPEDQLRGPLEALVTSLAAIGLPGVAVYLVGETTLGDIKTRPDYAVEVNKALVGFIEIKAPGKGADPRRFTDPHDKEQWSKLKSLPNLIYTDGNSFSLWQDGALIGKIAHLDGDIVTSGAKLKAPSELLPLVGSFLQWNPIAPSNAKKLAETSARLCRLLRDEVIEQMELGNAGLTGLARDWRKLLFPEADDAQFADGYAQAVTFGLLIARAKDISLKGGIDDAAQELRKTNSLIGTALRLLTDDVANQNALKTSLGTLVRVLEQVNWATISKDKPDAWLYFYENFLEVYDNTLRKRTGSYYTPPEVVAAMARLCDEALRGPLFERAAGFASADVTVADPAVGTGTFLLGVLRRIAATVAEDQGEGAVRGAIEAAAQRLIGFELQFGPFAVAQLRLIAEMQTLMWPDEEKKKKGAKAKDKPPPVPDPRLFITDTLGNPFAEEEYLPQIMQPVAKSRRDANALKKGQPITVVIGNPPYKEKAEGRGGWIEAGMKGLEAPMDRWRPPAAWGVGAHTKHLKNLYVYFWRWATWKVFSAGLKASTGLEEKDEEGIVCFITVAGFLNGPGFEKMRDDLRRTCSDIWIIDCSPEGHQPGVATRIFQGVQQPVCIALAARKLGKDRETPARVRFLALPEGRREDKFGALETLSLDGEGWRDGPSGWRAPFLPAAEGAWANFPALRDLFFYDGSGVMAGRTWVIAPDATSLKARWKRLIEEKDQTEKERLFHPQLRDGNVASRHIRKVVQQNLGNKRTRPKAIVDDADECETPIRYPFRSFDRQWIIADARLINDVRPILWNAHSLRQFYLTAPDDRSPTAGPAVTFANLVPDLHHYNGRGGRVYPLWRDAAAKDSNIRPTLLAHLAPIHGAVGPDDMLAYIAAVMAHPAFTKRFARDLVQPGLRVPLTADAKLFQEAVALGREIVWLHSYGERFADPAAGRPKQAPRMARGTGPTIPAGGAIPSAPEPLPDMIDHERDKRRLRVGKGYIDNVSPEMWEYEVSGKQTLRQWFSYRRRDRSKPPMGDKRPPSPLDAIQPEGWLAEYTSDLFDLLHVLGRLIACEPAQADLLARICDGPLLKADELRAAGALGEALTESGVDKPAKALAPARRTRQKKAVKRPRAAKGK